MGKGKVSKNTFKKDRFIGKHLRNGARLPHNADH